MVDFSNIAANKKRSKKREFNNYDLVTKLVKKYKETGKDEDLLAVLNALEGIINTYTLICTPSDSMQNVYVTQYMCKFLGMFLTNHQGKVTNSTYMSVIYKIRGIMKSYEYEDIYSKIIELLISIVKSMKIVGDCNCIYYIQLLLRYKLYDLIIKNAKDASSNIHDFDLSVEDSGNSDHWSGNTIHRKKDKFVSLSGESYGGYEEKVLDDVMYREIPASILVENYDYYKIFDQYEKFLLYLRHVVELNDKQIIRVVRHDTMDGITNAFEIISGKIELLNQEYQSI